MSEATNTTQQEEELTPIILMAGRRSKKAIKKLKRGEGKLMAEVNELVRETRASGKDLGPIVIVYKEKLDLSSASSMMKMPFPSPFNFFGKS